MRGGFIGTEGFVLLDTIRRLNRRQAKNSLTKVINKIHPGELAWIFRHLTASERLEVFQAIDPVEKTGEFLSETDDSIRLELICTLEPPAIVEVVETMFSDDVADLIEALPEDLRAEVLALMNTEDAAEVEELMQYEPDTAGGIMSPNYLAMEETMEVSDAIKRVQDLSEEAEMAFYLYVVDGANNLKGVVSLRQLLMNKASKKLASIMQTDVVAVSTETDQEEVAAIASRYNIMAVPVVDHSGGMLGIVTVDDIIDIIREEATEDFLQMVGAGKDREILLKPMSQNVFARLPWLLASWIGGVLAMAVISRFQSELTQLIALAGFIPVITGMGGNIGTQSSTLTIRGLATGRVNPTHTRSFILKQLGIGLFLGVIFGILLGVLAWVFYDEPYLGIVVALAICASMLISASLGTMVPIFLRRLDIDPAIATGPFVTTTTDVLGVLIYFMLAQAMLF